MIDEREIERRAEQLGLLPTHVRKDYLLNHLLAAAADASAPLLLRGATALARVYWPDFRLSEDLDFISTASGTDIDTAIRSAVTTAAARTGTTLTPIGRTSIAPPIRAAGIREASSIAASRSAASNRR